MTSISANLMHCKNIYISQKTGQVGSEEKTWSRKCWSEFPPGVNVRVSVCPTVDWWTVHSGYMCKISLIRSKMALKLKNFIWLWQMLTYATLLVRIKHFAELSKTPKTAVEEELLSSVVNKQSCCIERDDLTVILLLLWCLFALVLLLGRIDPEEGLGLG